MPNRRVLLAITISLALAGLLVGVAPVEAAPQSNSLQAQESEPESGLNRNSDNIQTWNMCSGWHECPNDVPSTATGDLLVYSVVVAAKKPRFIALQEVCRTIFDDMEDNLDDYNYDGNFRSSNDNADSDCDDHGNAVFWKGGCDAPCRYGNDYSIQVDSAGDERGYVCGTSDTLAFYGCSTHLDVVPSNGNTSVTDLQQYYFRLHTNQARAFQITYGAGDFNLPPSANNNFAGWHGLYKEGNVCFCGSTSDSHGKIDYAWAGDNHCTRPYNSFISAVDESDHHVYRAYFNC